VLAISRWLPIVLHAHPNARVRYVRSDERFPYDLGTRSLRQNRSKSQCHDHTPHTKRWTRSPVVALATKSTSRSAVVQVLQRRPRPCRRRLRPRRWRRMSRHQVQRTPP